MNSSERRPNYREIARIAGCCPATVSLAFRNHPSIPPETRNRIHQVAQSLGYQPNPRIAELMRVIRKNRNVRELTEAVALYWSDASQAQVHQYLHLCGLENATRQRLANAGFRLEIFYLDSGSPTAVERQLRAQGIRGVLLAPLIHQSQNQLDWRWEHLSPLVLGSASWTPDFHRIRFHHFEDIAELLHSIPAAESVSLVLDATLDERSRGSIRGGFLAHAKNPSADPIFLTHEKSASDFKQWLRKQRSKNLIIASPHAPRWIPRSNQAKLYYFDTLLAPSKPCSGIEQNYNRLAEVAAEQLIEMLASSQFGIPLDPIQVLIRGSVR